MKAFREKFGSLVKAGFLRVKEDKKNSKRHSRHFLEFGLNVEALPLMLHLIVYGMLLSVEFFYFSFNVYYNLDI